jgi:hypothetical protein
MVKLTKEERIDEFWEWFNAHKYYYEEIESEWDPGLSLLEEKVATIDEDAYLEAHIINDVSGKHQIVISAYGLIDYFTFAREVVDAAPEMIGWNAVAFVQPGEIDYKLYYKSHIIEPSELFFMPYLDGDQFNLILYKKELGEIDTDEADSIAKMVTISIIGEYHYATKVSACLLQDYSEAIEEECLLPANQLYNFVVNNFMNSN